MALSRRAAHKAGIEQLCPFCGQPTVRGPHDTSSFYTVTSAGIDLSEHRWTLTQAGQAELAQWCEEHPEQAEELRAWAHDAVTRVTAGNDEPETSFCGWATSYAGG